MVEGYDKLQERIGYCFRNPELLQEALTHRSFANEQRGLVRSDNERLEFLGDAVLGLVIAETLYLRFPHLPEGEMTRLRAELVNSGVLAALARQIDLGVALRLGRGEAKGGGRDKETLLADALEALLGAIYLEAGVDAVRTLVLDLFSDVIRTTAGQRNGTDYKTRLQEYQQAHRQGLPEYLLVSIEGPDHNRLFKVEARVADCLLGSGQGKSKKEAEQSAARAALERLQT